MFFRCFLSRIKIKFNSDIVRNNLQKNLLKLLKELRKGFYYTLYYSYLAGLVFILSSRNIPLCDVTRTRRNNQCSQSVYSPSVRAKN